MASIHDLFTYYLKAEHLQGRSVTVHIESATVTDVFNPRTKRNEPRLLIRFHGKKLGLLCNKTQAGVLARLTGTDDYTRWPGHSVVLTPGKAGSGQDTITVSGPQVEQAA
jgi:hypothetical protein